MNLKIIGTSHIAKQSIEETKKAFNEFKPDIVALELDPKRFYALMQKKQRGIPNIFKIGARGFLFSVIGHWIQQKLGQKVGVKPGAEMLTAIKLARKNKVQIALIDQDIEITLRKLSKELSWKERVRIAKDIIRGVIFKKDELPELELKHIDLTKVPEKELISKLLLEVKKRYPGIYKVLVDDRNKLMAKNIVKILQKEPDKKMLVIIGAGHEESIKSLVEKSNSISFGHSFSVAG